VMVLRSEGIMGSKVLNRKSTIQYQQLKSVLVVIKKPLHF